jgi:hypothetical protein
MHLPSEFFKTNLMLLHGLVVLFECQPAPVRFFTLKLVKKANIFSFERVIHLISFFHLIFPSHSLCSISFQTDLSLHLGILFCLIAGILSKFCVVYQCLLEPTIFVFLAWEINAMVKVIQSSD